MNIKVTFFKTSGKYYTEEIIAIPAEINQVFQIVDWLEKNVKSYRGMHLIAMLDEYDNGYPIMIPADRRN